MAAQEATMLKPATNTSTRQAAIIRKQTDHVFVLMTVKQLSDKTGIKETTLRAAKSRGRFSLDIAQSVANAVGVSLYDLRPDCVGVIGCDDDGALVTIEPKKYVTFFLRPSIVGMVRSYINKIK